MRGNGAQGPLPPARKVEGYARALRRALDLAEVQFDMTTGVIRGIVNHPEGAPSDDVSTTLARRIAEHESARPGGKPGAGAVLRRVKPTKDRTS
jgi:hypothetical protein